MTANLSVMSAPTLAVAGRSRHMALLPGPMFERAISSKKLRVVLGVGAFAYVAAALAANWNPGPRVWGLPFLSLLPPVPRVVIGILLLLGATWLALGPARALPHQVDPANRKGARAKARKPKPPGRHVLLPLLLLPLGAAFALFRARTQFLGDGAVWLSGLQAN